MSEKLSYHDLYLTTEHQPRISIFNLPFGVEVSCTRVGGWQVWQHSSTGDDRLIAGEFDKNWLVLDVNGMVILDSRDAPK